MSHEHLQTQNSLLLTNLIDYYNKNGTSKISEHENNRGRTRLFFF